MSLVLFAEVIIFYTLQFHAFVIYITGTLNNTLACVMYRQQHDGLCAAAVMEQCLHSATQSPPSGIFLHFPNLRGYSGVFLQRFVANFQPLMFITTTKK